MGAQLSKGGVAAEGKAVVADPAAAKANGQENGHVKTNGDVSAKPGEEVAAAEGTGTAEPAKEGENGTGDAIEPAPAAEGDAAKAEGDAAKECKKKKKFSLKNSFKFKGISLKKTKKGSEEAKEEVAASPTTEEKPEENGHAAKETKEQTPAAEAKEEEVAAPAAEAAPEGEAKAAEEAPTTEAAPAEEAAAPPAEDTTPAASEGEAKAE
ncbi:hypothetical protein CesoFtcFv8_017068 [Champsocephalus esox]|uniref:Uncharacterized protein n=1 Tax=Champsocephalus esox TaxID=159716 RepID=A0AAN8BIR4_9TELE|nr:hypothetical protein CesoFtcFv8_017068 [Champsocephalus esox]